MLPKDTQLVSAEAGTEAQIPKPMQRGFFSLPHPNHPMSFLPLPSPQYPGPPWGRQGGRGDQRGTPGWIYMQGGGGACWCLCL